MFAGVACAAALTFLPHAASAQVPGASGGSVRAASPRLSAAAFRADVALLRRAYETLHPGLYRYATPDEVARRFDALARAIDGTESRADAFVALARFLATVQCGHTYPNFFNQPDSVAEALYTRTPRLPVYFRWIDGRMVVTRSFAAPGSPAAAVLRRGAEIAAVDGVPSDTLLARLMPFARADGGNDAKRVASLAVQGQSRFEAFDVYWPLVFAPAADSVTLDVRSPDLPAGAPPVRVRAATATHAQRLATLEADRVASGASSAGASGSGPWSMRTLGDSTAVLAMPTWAVYNDAWDWQGFLQRTFDALVASRTPRLVIDLRGNEGGLSVGDAVLSRLAASDLPLPQFTRHTRVRRVPADLVPHLDTWDRSFDDWGDAAVDTGDGFFRLTRGDAPDGGDVIRPRGPRFEGRVAVLVDATNSSATFAFAQQVQAAGLATLVGEPTGGNQRGINGGAFHFLRLPNSGFEADLPLIGFFPPSPRPDAGITPDVRARDTAASIAAGTDPVLDAALSALKRR